MKYDPDCLKNNERNHWAGILFVFRTPFGYSSLSRGDSATVRMLWTVANLISCCYRISVWNCHIPRCSHFPTVCSTYYGHRLEPSCLWWCSGRWWLGTRWRGPVRILFREWSSFASKRSIYHSRQHPAAAVLPGVEAAACPSRSFCRFPGCGIVARSLPDWIWTSDNMKTRRQNSSSWVYLLRSFHRPWAKQNEHR